MASMDDVAKGILKGKKLKKAAPGTGKVKLPPPNKAMKAQSELKKAEMTAPTYKKTTVPTEKATTSKKRSSMALGVAEDEAGEKAFKALERDLPKGGRAMRMAEEVGEQALDKPAKKGASRVGKMAAAGLVGGAVGLGIDALMEGLDAEDTGSEEENMAVSEKRQREKTTALVKGKKKLPSTLEASTKKKVSPSKGYRPKVAGPKEIEESYMKRLDKEWPVEDYANVEEQDESGKTLARYRLKMKSKERLTKDEKARAAGLHSALREEGGKGGKITIPEYGEPVWINKKKK